MHYLYILKSKDGKKSYVGHTDNIERRLREHNSGKSVYTSKFRPWKVLYTEEYQSEVESIKRERYFKSHAGRRRMRELFEVCPVV